ncbi:MAG: NnrU family protein, partial [Burkholderiaceae bacterium]|nr:NnrU family protein [Burkholderiaceae bacterium]
MVYLLAGLFIFLGVHSVRIVADTTRTRLRVLWGANTYKGVYTVLSLLGFGLIVWGFGLARETPAVLWMPPTGMRHLAALLTLPAFVFLAAAYVPANAIKARVHHPMVLSVKTWALAHLLTTGTVAHVLLFG